MSWKDVPMPPAVATLARDVRGFPITFVTLIQPDGRPDFTTIDGEKVARCIRESICGICGFTLKRRFDRLIAFIGGPKSCESEQFFDPPMHPTCAEYSMQVCPHLAINTARFSKPKEGEGREVNPYVDPERPERFGIYYTDGFEVALVDGWAVLMANPPIGEIIWNKEVLTT